MPSPYLLTAPQVEVSTRPALGRQNQDRTLVLPHAAAALDGATDPDEPTGRDGGWYADQLTDALRTTLTPGRPIPDAVAAAISTVARNGGLTSGSAPSSTVAVAAWDEGTVTAYALGDSVVVAVPFQGPARVVLDDRLHRVATSERRSTLARLAAGSGYDAEHRDAMCRVLQVQRENRNRHGGYWIAETLPGAAHHAVSATWPRAHLRALLIATDGAAAGLDYGRHDDWLDAWRHIDADGAAQFLAKIEEAEATDPDGLMWPRSKPYDDKTLIIARFSSESNLL